MLSDANIIIDKQINEKLKRIMEQRNIHTDHYKRTWLYLIDSNKEADLKENLKIKIEKIPDFNKEDDIYLFDALSGDCIGLFVVINIEVKDESLTIDLKKSKYFEHTLNIKEVLSNDEVSMELKSAIVENIGGLAND